MSLVDPVWRTPMKTRTRTFLLALTIASLAIILIPALPAQSDCNSDPYCWTCLSYRCRPATSTAHCSCEHSVYPKYCVAGGGTCHYYAQR